MNEERPIVFTVSKSDMNEMYRIYTHDGRGSDENVFNLYADELFKTMLDISEVLNDKGYAVLFEVD